MTRTDLHKPSLLDPAEYSFAACFYQGSSDEMHDAYCDDHREYSRWIEDGRAVRENTQVFEGNYAAKFTCDHCGATFAHGVVFLHKPTGDLIHVGHICASDTIGLPSKAAATRKRAEKAAARAREQERLLAAADKWRTEHPAAAAYLTVCAEEEAAYRAEMLAWNEQGCPGAAPVTPGVHNFIRDMIFTVNRYGGLTNRQELAVLKFAASHKSREERQAEKAKQVEADATREPLVEGKRQVEGEIVSVKFQDGLYGETLKMLVREDGGNKVWGTVPRSIESSLNSDGILALKGQRVRFSATVERSKDDENFGFFKRPTGATLSAPRGAS
jgi:hypothetical protein